MATPVQPAPATVELARQLAVDLATVRGTGALGRITTGDVRQAHRRALRRRLNPSEEGR